jgi:hypothetical protein
MNYYKKEKSKQVVGESFVDLMSVIPPYSPMECPCLRHMAIPLSSMRNHRVVLWEEWYAFLQLSHPFVNAT